MIFSHQTKSFRLSVSLYLNTNMDVVDKVDEKSKILVEGTTDENVRLIQYLPVKTEILVVSLIISCIIALSIKSIFIKYVLLHATKRRPINTLILLEQVTLFSEIIGFAKVFDSKLPFPF